MLREARMSSWWLCWILVERAPVRSVQGSLSTIFVETTRILSNGHLVMDFDTCHAFDDQSIHT